MVPVMPDRQQRRVPGRGKFGLRRGRQGPRGRRQTAPGQDNGETPEQSRFHQRLLLAVAAQPRRRRFQRFRPKLCSRSRNRCEQTGAAGYSAKGGVSPSGRPTWNTLRVFPISV